MIKRGYYERGCMFRSHLSDDLIESYILHRLLEPEAKLATNTPLPAKVAKERWKRTKTI